MRRRGSDTERVKKIFEWYKELLGVRDAKLQFKEYKTKVASCSLKRRVVTLDSRVSGLDDDAIGYVILHELLHLKLDSKHHGNEFHRLLKEFLTKEEVEENRSTIFKQFLAES